jgi:hypothetical protein
MRGVNENAYASVSGDLLALAYGWNADAGAYADLQSYADHNNEVPFDRNWADAGAYTGAYANKPNWGPDAGAEGWIFDGNVQSISRENNLGAQADVSADVEMMGSGAHLIHTGSVDSEADLSLQAGIGPGATWPYMNYMDNWLYTDGPGLTGTVLDDAGSLEYVDNLHAGACQGTSIYTTDVANKDMINWVAGNDPNFPGFWDIDMPVFTTTYPGGNLINAPIQVCEYLTPDERFNAIYSSAGNIGTQYP